MSTQVESFIQAKEITEQTKAVAEVLSVENQIVAKENESIETTAKAASRDLLAERSYYKPFEDPQFFEYFKLQQQAHWLPTEVPMADDVTDFKANLTAQEANLIIQVLRFFTQGDIEVQNNYNSQLVNFCRRAA